MLEYYQKRISYDQQKQECDICETKFQFFKRQHKCKRCKLIICYDCGKNKEIIFGYIDQQKHRVCIKCFKDIEYQQKFVEINKVKWNQNSRKGQRWFNLIKIEFEIQQKLSYQQLLENAEQDLDFCQKVDNIVDKFLYEFNNLQNQFNFSINQFIYQCQIETTQGQIEKNIKNILKAYQYENKQYIISYQSIIFMMIFMPFFEECQTYILFKYILEKVLPTNYYDQQFQEKCLQDLINEAESANLFKTYLERQKIEQFLAQNQVFLILQDL